MKRGLKHNYQVSEYEDMVIRNKAKRAKISVSAYVRKAALQKDIVVIDGLREMIPELHAIGNNLNQQTVIMRQHHGNALHVDEMKHKDKCAPHSIRVKALHQILLLKIQEVTAEVRDRREEFLRRLSERNDSRQRAGVGKTVYCIFGGNGMALGHAVSCFIRVSRGIKPTKS